MSEKEQEFELYCGTVFETPYENHPLMIVKDTSGYFVGAGVIFTTEDGREGISVGGGSTTTY